MVPSAGFWEDRHGRRVESGLALWDHLTREFASTRNGECALWELMRGRTRLARRFRVHACHLLVANHIRVLDLYISIYAWSVTPVTAELVKCPCRRKAVRGCNFMHTGGNVQLECPPCRGANWPSASLRGWFGAVCACLRPPTFFGGYIHCTETSHHLERGDQKTRSDPQAVPNDDKHSEYIQSIH